MTFPSPGNMMLPNITINVQSGNKDGTEYADNSDRSARYSSDYRQSNDPTYAPAVSENNPSYSSYERGDESWAFTRGNDHGPVMLYNGAEERQGAPAARYDAPSRPPLVASPQAAERARLATRRLRALPPERVGERFYKEFP